MWKILHGVFKRHVQRKSKNENDVLLEQASTKDSGRTNYVKVKIVTNENKHEILPFKNK